MLARWSDPWWKPVLVGSAVTLVFLAVGLWALTVLSAAIAGFLSGRGRRGAVAGIQSAAPVWILWLFVLALLAPVEGLLLILGGILGPGWGLVVFLFVLIPILLGAFGGMAGGFLAELLSRDEPKAVAVESDPAAR
jgi:MFS family permease